VWNQQKKTFVASPFNFYTFPSEFRGIDRRFVCQTRCMQFLSNSNLDFNKLFKSGVPFLNHQEVPVRAASVHLFPKLIQGIDVASAWQEELIRSCGGKDAAFIEATRASLVDFICQSAEESMLLPPADGYHRMLSYRELTDTFQDVLRHERATAVRPLSSRRVCIYAHVCPRNRLNTGGSSRGSRESRHKHKHD
jgi:poly(A)-specific ribonuclease